MHILLVEDDDRIAAALRPALHRHGMTTSRLATGRGAVDHLGGLASGPLLDAEPGHEAPRGPERQRVLDAKRRQGGVTRCRFHLLGEPDGDTGHRP